jgi:hypothetical protein
LFIASAEAFFLAQYAHIRSAVLGLLEAFISSLRLSQYILRRKLSIKCWQAIRAGIFFNLPAQSKSSQPGT